MAALTRAGLGVEEVVSSTELGQALAFALTEVKIFSVRTRVGSADPPAQLRIPLTVFRLLRARQTLADAKIIVPEAMNKLVF